MGISTYEGLLIHVGHDFECITYRGPDGEPANVSLECLTCCAVIIGFDKYPDDLVVDAHADNQPPVYPQGKKPLWETLNRGERT